MRACIKKEKHEEKFQVSKFENDDSCDIRITTSTDVMTLDAYKQGWTVIKCSFLEIVRSHTQCWKGDANFRYKFSRFQKNLSLYNSELDNLASIVLASPFQHCV